ncbi:hypothetical protein [Herbaspirillum chlorophenolicum]|uniref:hypothetical protein n=1 Tax=Herbaspirillum chlorophenolicum TaxID=211589 RepID=UPI0012E12499|nr:hypothetical protein [Herbaspirillum chlorophenolicum]
MSHNNHGTQKGDGSLNVGVGDFRGANINVGGSEKQAFTQEQMSITRHPTLGGRSIKSGSLNAFGIVTGIASLIGLYLTLFSAFPQPKYASWSTLFLFSLAIAITMFIISATLKRRKFEPFLFRKYYLEADTQGGLYLNSFTATCPWCSSKMNLRNVGPKNGPRDDLFICERNPKQHTILLDPTVLSDIDEQ